jgi:transposase InsO family protein
VITAEKANYPITLMCRVLGVSRSGWYASQARLRPTVREVEDADLIVTIREIHTASRGTYGSPRVHAQLVRDGLQVGKHRVARLMRAADVAGRVRPRFKVTTDSRHELSIAPNTLNREFAVESSDSVWCADITYIATAAGWVYLAAIIDLASRMIVGWSMANHMRTELVESALLNALTWRAPAARLVHHSDRGGQYASDDYRALLQQHGIV